MSDPLTYSFYGTTIPSLRNMAASAINILTTAKEERSTNNSLPSEKDILDSQLGDMLPFRMQPILLAKFPLTPLQNLKLNGSAPGPALNPGFASFDEVIDFLKQLQDVFDAVDAKAFNDSADKSVDISFEAMNLTLHMTGLADYFHSFVVPNSYFHLNTMYMLLRSKGFKLGKTVYISPFMSEQQQKDWAPMHK